MFKVMAMIQTNGGSITRVVGEFGGPDGLQAADAWRIEVLTRPTTLAAWIA